MKPIVAVTTWTRSAPTFISDDTTMYTLLEDYARALAQAGAVMLLVGALEPDGAPAVLDRVDGLVVTGGGDLDPAMYDSENTHSANIDQAADLRDLALIRAAQRRAMPVLGICRGLQAVNVALGGTLRQEVNGASDDHPALADTPDERNLHRHAVIFSPDCRLADIYGSTERKVNSLHHQGIEHLGVGLRSVGETADGSVEAIESLDPRWPLIAVQWHPEMLDDPAEDRLFRGFADYARHWRA